MNARTKVIPSEQKTDGWLIVATALFLLVSAHAQEVPALGLYRVVSGTYSECCGFIGVPTAQALPDEQQSYFRLTADEAGTVTLEFLGADARTVFRTVPCDPLGAIVFSFGFGHFVAGQWIFHADPGPPPHHSAWDYTVTGEVAGLRVEGTLQTLSGPCSDTPTRFEHLNVVATPVPPPRLTFSEITPQGPLLRILGNAGWTDILEASTDQVHWTPISTNVMPFTLCPACPFVLVQDNAGTDLPWRFYRCQEVP